MPKRHEAALKIKPILQKGAQTVSDEEALEVKGIYPEWESGIEYTTHKKVLYKGTLYRCLQGHTSQEGWTPDVAASLWVVIDETHAGTITDPIPYNGNMALEQGKYYTQFDVIYLCTRDTVIAVFSDLKDLVGLYVEAA